MPAKDASVARFVARYAVDRRTEAREDVAPYLHLTAEERGRHFVAACRAAAAALVAEMGG